MTDIPVTEMLAQRRWSELRKALVAEPAPHLADLLFSLRTPEMVIVFRLLPRELAAEVFAYLERSDRNALLRALTDEETRHLLQDMDPDDRTDLLQELPGEVTQSLMNLLSPADLKEVRQLLGYPEESVGRLMTPDYVAVRPQWTVGEALQHIRTKGKDSETIAVIYVVDSKWKLLDALDVQKFILADPSQTVESIMDYSFVFLSAFDDRERAVWMMQRYDLFAVPVVNSDGVLIGIVTVDDVLDVAQEEATEDFHKGAAVAPLRTSYREASIWELYRKRIGWLVALVFVNLISSGVIAAFEETLATALALAFFIPLLIDSSGNAGAQSATLMVRALATGDLSLNQWVRTLVKEVGVGLSIGLTMAVASWVLGLFRGGFLVGVVVGLTMLAIVLVGNTIGVLLPFLLIRLRLDPAVASGPLITSIADAAGLLIYFSIATWVFRLVGGMG
ncbi:MAG: magnesium transporter [Bacillota bacterium]|jgi:magnesium transporter